MKPESPALDCVPLWREIRAAALRLECPRCGASPDEPCSIASEASCGARWHAAITERERLRFSKPCPHCLAVEGEPCRHHGLEVGYCHLERMI